MEEENKKEDKAEEYLNGWKRERADFLNYKKDEMERIGQMIKYANEELILNLFPVLDNLCLAAQHISDPGIGQIEKQLSDFLAKEGIEHIEVLDKPFDPNTMEAIGEIEAEAEAKDIVGCPTPHKSGTVVEEVQRGYTMHGKLIRPAKVKVTK